MAKGVGGGEPIPLSRFGALVAQLESVVASARQKTPDALLCFDLLSELSSAIDEAPKETIQLWQRKCEDALQSLLVLGARRPVRRLASSAMGRIIEKGDVISVYSRASNLQGWLVDVKRADAIACAGVPTGVTLLEFEQVIPEEVQDQPEQAEEPTGGEAPAEDLPECPDHRPSTFLKGDMLYQGFCKTCLHPAGDED